MSIPLLDSIFFQLLILVAFYLNSPIMEDKNNW